jgi:FMN reductase
MTAGRKPLIIGLGGTTRSGSSSELVLRAALAEAARLGAETELIAGPDLVLPLYAPEDPARDPAARRMIDLIQRCDGLIIASPGYHGSISGMIKNALDYIEDLRQDERPYLDGRAVGCVSCAYGWQATGSVLAALRSIVHALRGWPTPLGIGVNTLGPLFDADGACTDAALSGQLAILATQVVSFAHKHAAEPGPAS